ncbi:hypothetical protein [Candidatus Vallotia lariciata]|nr:hypothetical protein [Candidatus Vallotia lariciata]
MPSVKTTVLAEQHIMHPLPLQRAEKNDINTVCVKILENYMFL